MERNVCTNRYTRRPETTLGIISASAAIFAIGAYCSFLNIP